MNRIVEEKVSDILVLQENFKGSDFIVGDIHGSLTILKKTFEKLGQNDRLFITGDLIDRGEDSAGVCKFVEEHKNQIFVIRGNHEQMFLNFVGQFKNSQEMEEFLGRLWGKITEHYAGVASENLTKFFYGHEEYAAEFGKFFKAAVSREDKDFEKFKCWYECIVNGGGWVFEKAYDYKGREEIFELSNQLANLPYIIHVMGKNPFNVAHADMPFSDEKLLKKIQKGSDLSEEDRFYTLWAREGGGRGSPAIDDKNRDEHSIRTYCGHTILKGLRVHTNTVNLDMGAYDTNRLLMVNHTSPSVDVIQMKNMVNANAEDIEAINKIRDEITEYLRLQRIETKENLQNKFEDKRLDAEFKRGGYDEEDIKEIINKIGDKIGENDLKNMLDLYGVCRRERIEEQIQNTVTHYAKSTKQITSAFEDNTKVTLHELSSDDEQKKSKQTEPGITWQKQGQAKRIVNEQAEVK